MIFKNMEERLINLIGDISWNGEIEHDKISLQNLDKLDKIMSELEVLRGTLMDKLTDHRVYEKGNASAEQLHNKAKEIMEKHLIREFAYSDFDEFWEGE